MQTVTTGFLLLVSFLGHCGQADQTARQANVNGSRAGNEVSSEKAKVSTGECNFSAYKAIREDHFVRRALVKSTKPLYPPEAVREGIQGWINVRILVNRSGDVEKACAIDGDENLKTVSEDAALQWKFKPNFGLSSPGRNSYREDVIAFHFLLDKLEKPVSKANVVTIQPRSKD